MEHLNNWTYHEEPYKHYYCPELNGPACEICGRTTEHTVLEPGMHKAIDGKSYYLPYRLIAQ